jgi:hypothetical protein
VATHDIWRVRWPNSWPAPPSPMSFTALRAIERCPLQWSLSRASYTDLWPGFGYPERPYPATVIGRVVHGALEVITRELTKNGISSPSQPNAVRILKEMGGITAVLEQELQKVVDEVRKNPRVTDSRDMQAQLVRALPTMRQRVQLMLSRLDPSRAEPEIIGRSDPTGIAQVTPQKSSALPLGAHAETTLRHPDGTWYGKVDLLRLSDQECEIVDFKTGSRKDDHQLQVKLYALLWHRDRILNPKRRLATRLALAYPDGIVEVSPPSESTLDVIEAELNARASAAHQLLSTQPAEARPDRDVCRFCSVRQSCPVYWKPATQIALGEASPPGGLSDVEVRIHGRSAQWTWKGIVKSCGRLPTGTSVLVRTPPQDSSFTTRLDQAKTVRLLGVQVFEADEESPNLPVLSVTRTSEMFEFA